MRCSPYLLAGLISLVCCTKQTTVTAPVPQLPGYELDMVGTAYAATYGDWSVSLKFEADRSGLVAVLSRDEDELRVEFAVRSEFFPFATYLPRYLVLTPVEPWAWQPYAPATAAVFAPLLLDVYSYTQAGTVWPPSGMDNIGQSNPLHVFTFARMQ
tara:strand:+ start:82 stop:549 length:468 start_codon:yes stop_codon:yes gene_type:complete